MMGICPVVVILIGLVSFEGPLVTAQFFDPKLDDKAYLDMIESEISAESEAARVNLLHHAHVIEELTKDFIGIKLKENIFKRLRVLAEEELRLNSKQNVTGIPTDDFRQTRQQEEEEEESGGGSEDSTRRNQIIPTVANLIKAVFGGNSINLTSYVESASKYLPPTVGNQFLGVVKLISNNPSVRWSSTTPPPPTTRIPTTIIPVVLHNVVKRNSTEGPTTSSASSTSLNGGGGSTTNGGGGNSSSTPVLSTTPSSGSSSTTEDEEEEEEEETSKARQLKIPGFGGSGGFNILGLFGPGSSDEKPKSTTQAPETKANATTESASGFEEEPAVTEFNLKTLATDVRNSVGDLIKVAPDIFKGAREAMGLINGIRNFIGSFGD